ncbi:hypothetical protein Nmel_018684 [Mimus melanotis]
MSSYCYQYKQQCYIPGGMKIPQQCQSPGLVPCASCSPCAPTGAKLCPARRVLARPCVVEERGSSCSSCSSSRCVQSCPAPFPQPLAPGSELRCAQVSSPGVCQDGSCPYSYQWSNSYQYRCGH